MFESAVGIRIYDIQIDATEASSHTLDAEPSILFPDRDLLFTGDFRRSGADLVLQGHDTTAIISNYFTRERRLTITTPEGASLNGEVVEALAGPDPPGQYAQSAGMAATRVAIGRVEKVTGSATVLRNGIPVDLRPGDTVTKGDVVQTASDSSLAIRFNDGTVFLLSPNARIVLNDMVYAAGATSNSSLITLVQGVIGFVAGQIAKTGDMKVDTPVATMAIRGTAVQTEISAFSGVTKISVLTEPDGSVGSIILFDKNNPSRVLTSVSDPRVATLLTPVAASDPLVTQIAKTADDLRGESDFVRNLFQVFSPQPQRRGSSDNDDILIIPTNFPTLIDVPDRLPINVRFETQERTESSEQAILNFPSLPEQIRGRAVEDGPLARLGAMMGLGSSASGTNEPVVILPTSLPLGVKYIENSRSFYLDPSHPVYQHLGEGETATITVHYNLLIEGTRVPTSVFWTVVGRNDAPVAADDTISDVSESARTTLFVRSNDRDIDGEALRITQWTSPLEGSLRLDASGNLVFDPGNDFQALSTGETATISFSYTIADKTGEMDTADATVKVVGSGTFSSPQQTSSTGGTLGFNDQSVALTLAAPSETTKQSAKLDLFISLGSVVQPQMNILYLIDVSGSTSEQFNGTSVGDLNNDGRSNTVLDAEIASLITLTDRIRSLGFSADDVSVTVIPFNSSADPTTRSGSNAPPVTAATFNLGGAGDETVSTYLKKLDSGGLTNFENALQAANSHLQELDQGDEKNVLYFLSDGAGDGSVQTQLAKLNDDFGAEIVAIGMGRDATLPRLNVIDNTGGATRLLSTDQIETSVLGAPLESGEISDVDVFVNGLERSDVGPDDLISRSKSMAIDIAIEGLDQLVGSQNKVSVVITFASGEVLTTELIIAGALPRSTDFVL